MAKTSPLDSILAGTDGNFTWDLDPDRAQAIKLKQSGVTADERQFLLDLAAAFDACHSVHDMEGVSLEVCPTQSRVTLQCANKGLGKLDGLVFELSKLGAAWLTINYPELSHETMGMVADYTQGRVVPLQ